MVDQAELVSRTAARREGVRPSVGRRALGWTVWLHRWSGVALCLLFATWFASGAVMVFVPYPSLSSEERASRNPVFDTAAMSVNPAEALAMAPGGGAGIRLVSVAGRPAYVVKPAQGPLVVIAADDASQLGPISAATAGQIAGRFAGKPVAAISEVITDQWVVAQGKDPLRPFYKVRLAGARRAELYVSSVTGEVAQKTLGTERAWNWAGSVLHWIYFTPLRTHLRLWTQVVYWLSLAGFATAVAGGFLAVLRSVQSLKRRVRWSPFRGWVKWHHVVGLVTGLFVTTWVFSGWLSMDSGALFHTGEASDTAEAAYRGKDLKASVAAFNVEDLRKLGPFSRLEFSAVAGQALAIAEGGPQPARRLLLAGESRPRARIPTGLIAAAVKAAWPTRAVGPVLPVSASDWYGLAEGASDNTVRIDLAGRPAVRIYVDGTTGAIGSILDGSRKAYAWLYFALHTLKLPGLASHVIWWRIVILTPLAAGFGFSLIGVVLALRRLGVWPRRNRQVTTSSKSEGAEATGPGADQPSAVARLLGVRRQNI